MRRSAWQNYADGYLAFKNTYAATLTTAIKQDVLLKILDISHEHGADVAFPTRTLHLDSAPPELAQAVRGEHS